MTSIPGGISFPGPIEYIRVSSTFKVSKKLVGHPDLTPEIIHPKDILIREEINIGKVIYRMADANVIQRAMMAVIPRLSIIKAIIKSHLLCSHVGPVIYVIRGKRPRTRI